MSPAPKPRAARPTPAPGTQRLLYDVPGAAFQLGGLSTREVKRRLALPVDQGGIRATRIGKRVFVSHAEILAVIARNTEAEK
jgi:hypothetical protein